MTRQWNRTANLKRSRREISHCASTQLAGSGLKRHDGQDHGRTHKAQTTHMCRTQKQYPYPAVGYNCRTSNNFEQCIISLGSKK